MPRRPLLTALLLLAAAIPAHAAKQPRAEVVVQDPYLELRSGPGRGYPVLQVVDRGRSVSLARRRTDWIKVESERGPSGWVHRSQLERTLTPQGDVVALPGPSAESRTEHRFEAGLATGDFAGASVVSVHSAYALTPSLQVRVDASQLFGNFSNGWLLTTGLAHVFAPHWRLAPFFALGGGVIRTQPDTTLIASPDRLDEIAYAGAGLRGFLSNRFLLQAEYRNYVVFTSRDDNEELDAWTLGFTYYF